MSPQFLSQARAAGWVASAVTMLLLAAPAAHAQFERGQVSGVVKDSTGGVLPGRDRHGHQPADTDSAHVTVTDGTGYYTFPNLQPGRYDVSAELEGFKKAVQSRRAARRGRRRSSLDFTLETGDMTEAVTVTAETTPLQSDVDDPQDRRGQGHRAAVASTAATRSAWPASRPASSAAASTTTASRTSATAATTSTAAATDENNITIDGATAIRTRSVGQRSSASRTSTPIQEVQVLTANYMPEFGRASGGQIRMVTKSGSNRYSRQRVVLLPRRQAAGQHAGRATAARTPSRTAGRRHSTTSSTATPSAARSRWRCSRTSCSSSARRSG